MDSTEETSTKDDLSTAETSTEDVREEIEEIVLSNLQSRHRIKMLAEREAELLKKKIEMEAQLRLLEYEVTAKEEQLESLKNVTDLQKTILNSVRMEMFAEQEKEANLHNELLAAEDSLNRLRVSVQHKREQRERRICEITARLKSTPWAVKRQEVLCTVTALKKELEEREEEKNTLIKEVEEKRAQVAGCKALPFKKFCISVALICLRMRDVRRSIAKELVKIAKIKEQLGENEVTPEVTQDSSQEPSSQSFVPSAVGAPVNESTAILTKQTEEVVLTEAPKDVSKVTGEAKYGVKGAEQSSEQRVVPLFGDKEADFDQNAHKEDAVNNDVSTSGADNSGSGEESSSLCRVIIDEEEQRESSELSPYENEDETMAGIENVSEANHFLKSTDDSAVKEKLFSEDMWDQGYQEHSREWNESGKGQTPPEGSLDGDDPSVFNDAPFEEAMLSDGASEQMLFMGGSGNSDDAESNVCPKSFFGNMDDNMEALYDLSDANKNASAEELDPAALLNLSSAVQGQLSGPSNDFLSMFSENNAAEADTSFAFNFDNKSEESQSNDNNEEPFKFFDF